MPTKHQHFNPSKAAEAQFSKALRKVAKVSGHIVEAHVHGDTLTDEPAMQEALKAYSRLIDPWARRQAAKMLEKVSRSNKTAYQRAVNARLQKKNAKEMSQRLKTTLVDSDIARTAAGLMHEQVELIKSIPLRAGMRAQQLARQSYITGARSDEIAKELLNTTDVSESTAKLIARTEVARSNAMFTQSRAQAVGSTWYIWRTVMDGAERHSHAEMNGKPVEYDDPPELSDGTVGHAGTFPNCRCYQDVQFDESD